MDRDAHVAIALRVLSALAFFGKRLPSIFVNSFIQGVSEPDNVHDLRAKPIRCKKGGYSVKYAPVKHHSVLEVRPLIDYYLDLALYLYSNGKLFDAGRALGRAVHYAQDAVLKRTKMLILDVHESLERKVNHLARYELNRFLEQCIPKELDRDGLYIYRKFLKPSSRAEDVVCRAISTTYALLYEFLRDADRWNSKSIRRRCRLIEVLRKALALVLAIAILWLLAKGLYIAIPLIAVPGLAVTVYRPRIYIYARRAGVSRPTVHGYRTAM